ncbi:MAG: RNA methyltransferase [Acidobacteriota bacterium]
MAAPPIREIRSVQNPSFKQWRNWILDPSSRDCPCLPVEGDKQVRELLTGRRARLLVVSESRRNDWLPQRARSSETVVVPDRLAEKLSPVRHSQGIVAFFDKPEWTWSDLTNSVVYADGLQDPGNLGTIVRTAAATGLFSVVTAPDTVSCFNDKVVRATAGYLFTVPILQHHPLPDLLRRGYALVVADSGHGHDLFSFPFRPPLAVVVGREGGSRLEGHEGATRLRIPMAEGVDSLNAAVAAGLIMYEALRRQLQGETWSAV